MAQGPAEPPPAPSVAPEEAIAAALRSQIDAADPEVAAFYRARGFRPFWTQARPRPEALELARALEIEAAAGPDDPWRLAEFEIALSSAWAARAAAGPKVGEGELLAFVDPRLLPRAGRGRTALEAAAEAASLQEHLEAALAARNPIVENLDRALERYRAQWSGLPEIFIPAGRELAPGVRDPRVDLLRLRLGLPDTGGAYDEVLEGAVRAFQRAHGLPDTGRADRTTLEGLNAGAAHYERLVEANLERASALPASFGERFILVDAAAGQLWYYDHGQQLAAMKVVTGKPSQPTPMMVGMVSHLIFNPYWNVPEDLVQTSIAPKVLEHGLGYIEEEGLEVLSDYTADAVVLDPAAVDWRAVAAGALSVRVRQKPGPKNMMGKVKLMLPNPLGIYLHDTPHRGDFARSQRLASSGCVRLEDAMSLARLLAGGDKAEAALAVGGEERRIDLAEPAPVYITYLTAAPTSDGFIFRPDVYGLDAGWASRHAAGAISAVGGD